MRGMPARHTGATVALVVVAGVAGALGAGRWVRGGRKHRTPHRTRPNHSHQPRAEITHISPTGRPGCGR